MVLAHPHNLRSSLLPATAVLIVLGAVIAALVLIGSPAQERRRWGDDVRAQDLVSIKYAVDRFYHQQKRLPESLSQLPQGYTTLRLSDALTKRPYDYRVLSAQEYELGAVFETDTSRNTRSSEVRSEHGWYHDDSLPFWKHGKGVHHFRVKVEIESPH